MGDEPKLVTLDAVAASLEKAKALAMDLKAKQEELWAQIGDASFLLQKLGDDMPYEDEDEGEDDPEAEKEAYE